MDESAQEVELGNDDRLEGNGIPRLNTTSRNLDNKVYRHTQ